MTRIATRSLAVVLVAVVLAVGCGDGPSTGGGGGEPAPGAPGLTGTITVAAASSLEPAFTRIAEQFEQLHPGTDVRFTFDSSSTLATQLTGGAPADVFASADEPAMRTATEQRLVAGEPELFTRNQLVVITKPGNPQGVTGPGDLGAGGVVALCAEAAPCGRYTAEVLAKAGATVPEASVTRAPNVRAVLTAVVSGDAVAGVVYASDARSAGAGVTTIEIPADRNVTATYPIAVLDRSGNPVTARAFLTYVVSDRGQAVLQEHGFLPVR